MMIENFWTTIGECFKWAQTESPFVVSMTLVGIAVTAISIYAMLAYVIPAVIRSVAKKIRHSKFIMRLHKKSSHKNSPKPRVIKGNINGSH